MVINVNFKCIQINGTTNDAHEWLIENVSKLMVLRMMLMIFVIFTDIRALLYRKPVLWEILWRLQDVTQSGRV